MLSEQTLLKKFKKIWLRSIERAIGENKEIAVVYSGGIDSSLVAFAAWQQGARITTFTVGQGSSVDVLFVQAIRDKLPFEAVVKEVGETEVRAAVKRAKNFLAKAELEENLMQISLAAGYDLVLEEVAQKGLKAVLSGQGADELFAGYFKALKLTPEEINPACRRELERLWNSDAKREEVINNDWQIETKYPFLDQAVVDFALALPVEWKLKKELGEDGRKYLLRKLGEELGLPEEITKRPKKAFQYSSGIQRIARKI